MRTEVNKHVILKQLKFIGIVVVLNVTLSLTAAYISHKWFNNIASKNTIKWDSRVEEFVFVVLFAPVLETLVLQVGSFQIINYVTKKLKFAQNTRNYIFIVIASVLFSCMHQYNWMYIISAFIGGISLNYSYIYFRKERFYPFLSVLFIHLLYNLSVTVIKGLAS